MAMETKVSKETVEKAISGKGINAVLVTYMVGVEQREVYTPPRYTPTASYYGGYYRHYSHARRSVYEPGYTTTYKTVKLETSLYEVATGKLVWSTQSETGSSESTEQLIHSKIKSVIDQLKKQKLI